MTLETLKIQATEDTPEIIFDPENGIYSITGCSIPENIINFYRPVLDWVPKLAKSQIDNLTFKFSLEYFNTASSRMFLEILKQLNTIRKSNQKNISVLWVYESDDDDMHDVGIEFSELIDIPFEFKEL